MSELTEFLEEEIKPLCDQFFHDRANEFDLTVNEGCGLYTEALVEYLRREGYDKVGHLKKNPGQTQYNGHANDAFLYREGDPILYRAVDIIGAAESTDPENPPKPNFGIDQPRYGEKDWMTEPNSEPAPQPDVVPWVPYDEASFNDRVQKQLSYDYSRRPQLADFKVSVWSARVFHSAYMGPEKKPLGFDQALRKHRPEWCDALGVKVDEVWF